MKKFLKKLVGFCFKLLLALFVFSVAMVILYRFMDPPITPLMVIRAIEDESDINKEWQDYEYVNEYMMLAVIAAEDQKFFEHHGFDIESIIEAWEDRQSGGRKRGASTISQQVAKNVFLWPKRTWVRKGLEVYFTAMIELFWDKKRILEVYVNVVELGDGVYGAEAAARKYYNTSAMQLTRNQGAMIATCLPNPRKFDVANPSGYMWKRQGWILAQMNNLGGTEFITHGLYPLIEEDEEK